MRWLAKKFFWSMILSSALLVGSQFFPQTRKYQSMAIQLLKATRNPAEAGSHEFRHGSDSMVSAVQKIVEDELARNSGQADSEGSKDLLEAGSQQLANTASSGDATEQDKFADPNTVVINGKVYAKSPDNIYIINGERVFYVDNRKHRKDPEPKAESAVRQTASTENLNAFPVMPGDMAENVQNAKLRMEERNKVLKAIETDDDFKPKVKEKQPFGVN